MADCLYPEHGKAPCGRCSGCCGGEEYCCATPDVAVEAWKRDALKAEAEVERLKARHEFNLQAFREVSQANTVLRHRLGVYVADIRGRADQAGPQAFAFTYRLVADELEKLLDG